MLHYDPRAVAHYDRTQYPDQNGHWAYEGQHCWLRGIHTSDKNGNACITGTTNFKISFKIWLLMHMMPYTGKVPWPSSATARGLGGGNDKLAIDKGGNLSEKVENHCSRRSRRNANTVSVTRLSCVMWSLDYRSTWYVLLWSILLSQYMLGHSKMLHSRTYHVLR